MECLKGLLNNSNNSCNETLTFHWARFLALDHFVYLPLCRITKMGMFHFHPVNNLVIARNWCRISLCNILLLLILALTNIKKFLRIQKYVFIFTLISVSVEYSKFMIFYKLKVAKHIWDPCCHLAAECGSRFILKH